MRPASSRPWYLATLLLGMLVALSVVMPEDGSAFEDYRSQVWRIDDRYTQVFLFMGEIMDQPSRLVQAAAIQQALHDLHAIDRDALQLNAPPCMIPVHAELAQAAREYDEGPNLVRRSITEDSSLFSTSPFSLYRQGTGLWQDGSKHDQRALQALDDHARSRCAHLLVAVNRYDGGGV